MNLRARFRGALLGLACGDALGAPFEGAPRNSFEPVTGMVGGGPYDVQPGQWTDDTSLALCLAASLVERDGFEPTDQMDRYIGWLTLGYMSSRGESFGIGNTTAGALRRYQVYGNPYSGSPDPRTAGNGSLMRLAPIPMFFFGDAASAIFYAGESSRTTHGAVECIDACRLFATMLLKALAGRDKETILFGAHFPPGADKTLTPKIQDAADGRYRDKSDAAIRGSGYVVECLEAALWCFYKTDSYHDAVLQAVNLGDDTDTTAAVCGQLAGAYYGEGEIPHPWLETLALRRDITRLADRLLRIEG
ncbi:MAG: ADP-ribosylglycohydrolase family protein [Caldilineaceae bacterium]|nr:ADP-ribosylglycohydrolase family protein [Caldilineaceae bacterium]